MIPAMILHLLILSYIVCTVGLRVSIRNPATADEEAKTKCCCDSNHYDPPQCKVLEESQLTTNERNPFKGWKTTLFGTKFCPEIDLFPGDGVGVRKTNNAKGLGEEARGCTQPINRDPLAELDFEQDTVSGIEVRLDIPESTQVLILLDSDDTESRSLNVLALADALNRSRFQRWMQRKRGAQLMSKWKLRLTKKVIGTVTSRPVYDLWLEPQPDDFQPASPSPLRLPLNKVNQVSRIDIDGRACVGVSLADDRRMLIVPYEPPNDGRPLVDLSANPFEDVKKIHWSLLAAPGVSNGNICCCNEVGEDCTLQSPPCSGKLEAHPQSCPLEDKEQESLAEELATQLAKAKRLAMGDADNSGRETGRRVLYQVFARTSMNCHSEAALRNASESGVESSDVGAELRTFKAIKGGSGIGGIQGLVRDVWGRHQHIRIGSGDSCIDLVYGRPSAAQMQQSGCGPYRAKSAMVAIVRECLDTAAAVELATVRSWRFMAQAYIQQAGLRGSLEAAGYAPAESWQKILSADVERIEQMRLAALTSDLQADRAGVWHILQRASIYAQKYFDDPESYVANINRKLDDVDKLFWSLVEKPGDGHIYPHKFNDRSPRDIVESDAYQALMKDEEIFVEKIVPALKNAGGEQTPQVVAKVVYECFTSLDCPEVPLLFKLMQQLQNASFWKKVPTGWLAGLAHAPVMYPTPPTSSQFIFPRSSKEAFGKCFTAPREAVEDARNLMRALKDQVGGKTWLAKHERNIFEASSSRSNAVWDHINEVLDEATGFDAEDIGTDALQGALACYPTLFGDLGMEKEIRDETGYKEGKRTEDMEQVLSQCSVAPQCARLAVERLLHFNTKKWDMYAGVTTTLMSYEQICNQPNPEVHSNCQLFAACFHHQLKTLCSEIPGCCGQPADKVCTAISNGTSTFLKDIRTVLDW